MLRAGAVSTMSPVKLDGSGESPPFCVCLYCAAETAVLFYTCSYFHDAVMRANTGTFKYVVLMLIRTTRCDYQGFVVNVI